MKYCLTIAGSDCSGGAGIQADIKTFSALGCYSMSVMTAVVAENTSRVISVTPLDAKCIGQQIDAVFEDIAVSAVKIGMLPDESAAVKVSEKLKRYKPQIVVCDPILSSTSGSKLSGKNAAEYLKEFIFPLCTLITPNLPEAYALSGEKNINKAAEKLLESGAKNVLIKGGHSDDNEISADILFDGKTQKIFEAKRIASQNTHGTGCTLSSAITAFLANGCPLEAAVANAKDYITNAIEKSFYVGAGHSPVNHFYEYYSMKGIETNEKL